MGGLCSGTQGPTCLLPSGLQLQATLTHEGASWEQAWGLPPTPPAWAPSLLVAISCLGWGFACSWLQIMKVQAVAGGHSDTHRGFGT